MFIGGEPGSKLDLGGFHGCIHSVAVEVGRDARDEPRWDDVRWPNIS